MSIDNDKTYCWFQSDTRLGCVLIGMEVDETAQKNLAGEHCVFQQAALLENAEIFVQAIELWQKIDLDLVPADSPDDSAIWLSLALKANTETNNTDRQSANKAQGVTVAFPCASFTQLAPLSEELADVIDLNGSNMMLQVQLDNLDISESEFSLLDSGSVVVLPNSYESEWNAHARSLTSEIQLDIKGILQVVGGAVSLLITPGAVNNKAAVDTTGTIVKAADDQTSHNLKVHCETPCSVPVHQLLGQSEFQLPLDASVLRLVDDEQLLARGAFLSFGKGHVMAVTELVGNHQA